MNVLLDMLKKEKVLTDSSVRTIEGYMKLWGKNAFDAVLECNLTTETELADIISKDLRIDRLYHLNATMVDETVLERLPFIDALELIALPVRYIGPKKDVLEVVLANPLEGSTLQRISAKSGCQIVPVVSEKMNIITTLYESYPLTMQIPALQDKSERV